MRSGIDIPNSNTRYPIVYDYIIIRMGTFPGYYKTIFKVISLFSLEGRYNICIQPIEEWRLSPDKSGISVEYDPEMHIIATPEQVELIELLYEQERD